LTTESTIKKRLKGDLLAGQAQRLEEELLSGKAGDDLGPLALHLARYFASESSWRNEAKAARYAWIAGEDFAKQGRLALALDALHTLNSLSQAQTDVLRLQRLLAHCFSARIQSKKSTDEHHAPPTSYQEFSARLEGSEMLADFSRQQWSGKTAQRIPLFSWLKADDVFEFIQRFDVRELSHGDELFKVGWSSDSFFLVVDGSLVLSCSDGWSREAAEGDLVGELSFLAQTRRSATARAGSDGARVIEFGRAAVQEVFARDPRIQKRVQSFYQYELFMRAAQRHALFEGLQRFELEEIWSQHLAIRVQQGTVVVNEQGPEARDQFYLVLEGNLVGEGQTSSGQSRWSVGQFCGPSRGVSRIVSQGPAVLVEFSRGVMKSGLLKCGRWGSAFDSVHGFDFSYPEGSCPFID